MVKDDFKVHLQKTSLFDALDSNELDMLIRHSEMLTFAKDDIILRQGSRAAGIYVIISGEVSVTAKVLGEGVTTIEKLKSGNIIGEVSFIEGGPCATSAIASNTVGAMLITREFFAMLDAYHPETEYKILMTIAKQVCERLQVMHQKITAYMANSDMKTRSLFSDVMHALASPKKLAGEELGHARQEFLHADFMPMLAPQEKDELLQRSTFLAVTKHHTLINTGDTAPPCYIVIRGAVQSRVIHDKRLAKLSVIGPKILFASISFIETNKAAITTYTACENAIVLVIPNEALEELRKTNIKLWYKLFQMVCRSLVALERSVEKLDIRLHTEIYNR